MDVLQYWAPLIDWTLFNQGPISNEVWTKFKQFVQLCHASQHWQAELEQQQLPDLSESKAKGRMDWTDNVNRCAKHRDRARFLAREKIGQISHLLGERDKGKPDHILWSLLWLSWGCLPFNLLALTEFDAVQELQYGDPCEIIGRWLNKAGLPETTVTKILAAAAVARGALL